MADDYDDDDEGLQEEAAEWLATFADMATLLLVFFILLLSMSTIEKPKYVQAATSVREAFGGTQTFSSDAVGTGTDERRGSAGKEDHDTSEETLQNQIKTFEEIRTYLSRSAEASEVAARFDEGKITLTIPADVMFSPGSEEVLPQAAALLHLLRNAFLKERQYTINIKGYTDNSPLPPGARFKDNWELSALRAVNILKEMLKGGIEPVRLTATGLGDLNPVAPNTSEENKAKNRRVEFVLERTTGG
jgi:Flagellar motor protein